LVVQHRFPLLLRKLDPETSISTPVPTRLFHRGSDYSHPRNLYSHARNPYSHPPGIFIHIAPESVSTCPGIRSIDVLSNSDAEFDSSAPSDFAGSQIMEVTQTDSSQVVWQMNIVSASVGAYRGYRIPSLYPGVTWQQ
jgi:hypothetical protein